MNLGASLHKPLFNINVNETILVNQHLGNESS